MSIGRPHRGAIAEINVTPMADVTIVLLIIFMVPTPVVVSPPVRLPSGTHPAEHRNERLEVVVRATGEASGDGLAFSDAGTLAEWISAGATRIGLVGDPSADR